MLGPAVKNSAAVRLRVVEARAIMADRYGDGTTNAAATERQLERFGLERAATDLLSAAHCSRGLSGRAHARVQRLARTIADLDGGGPVAEAHMARALQLRRRTGK